MDGHRPPGNTGGKQTVSCGRKGAHQDRTIKSVNKNMRTILFFLPAAMLTFGAVDAQNKSAATTDPTDSIYFSALKFRLVGPFRGGRADAVAGSLQDRNTFYFGATGGGLWKTTDGGSNWKNVSDGFFGGGVGAVAVAPGDGSIVYAGQGENTLRNNVSEDLGGIWRSGNGGRSWRDVGLKDSRHIARIVIDPKDPNIVWVAAMGHLFGPNTERGVYKTTDGGKTWRHVLYVNDRTACSDIAMEPGNPDVLYAGMWRIGRTPYSIESGGEGSGLYRARMAARPGSIFEAPRVA